MKGKVLLFLLFENASPGSFSAGTITLRLCFFFQLPAFVSLRSPTRCAAESERGKLDRFSSSISFFDIF